MNDMQSLKEERISDTLVVKIKGRLDAISSPNTEQHLIEEIEKGTLKLVLNFSELQYLSSAGLRILLTLSKKLKSLSGQMVICAPTPAVLDVMKMSGFDRIFVLKATEDEAVKECLKTSLTSAASHTN